MRVTEYMHYITRKDLKLGRREAPTDYTHLTIINYIKRVRYEYQCKLKGKEMVK